MGCRRSILVLLSIVALLHCHGASAMQNEWLRLALASQRAEKDDESVAYLLKAMEEARRFGSTDPRYTQSLRMLAKKYIDINNYEAAEPLLKRELAILQKLGHDYPDLDFDFFYLGLIREKKCQLVEAKKLFRQALDVGFLDVRLDVPTALMSACHLAQILHAQGDHKEAVSTVEGAVKRLWATWKRRPEAAFRITVDCVEHNQVGWHGEQKVVTALSDGNRRTIERLKIATIENSADTALVGTPGYYKFLDDALSACARNGTTAEVEDLGNRTLKSLSRFGSDDAELRAKTKLFCGKAYVQYPFGPSSKPTMKESERWLKAAIEEIPERQRIRSATYVDAMTHLASLRILAGHAEEGVQMLLGLLKSRDLGDARMRELHESIGIAYEWLPGSLVDRGEYRQAIPMYQNSAKHLAYCKSGSYYRVLARLGHLYYLEGRYDLAKPLLKEMISHTWVGVDFRARAIEELKIINGKH